MAAPCAAAAQRPCRALLLVHALITLLDKPTIAPRRSSSRVRLPGSQRRVSARWGLHELKVRSRIVCIMVQGRRGPPLRGPPLSGLASAAALLCSPHPGARTFQCAMEQRTAALPASCALPPLTSCRRSLRGPPHPTPLRAPQPSQPCTQPSTWWATTPTSTRCMRPTPARAAAAAPQRRRRRRSSSLADPVGRQRQGGHRPLHFPLCKWPSTQSSAWRHL